MARTTNITRYTCDRCHVSAYLADGDPRTSSDWHDITHTTVDGVAQARSSVPHAGRRSKRWQPRRTPPTPHTSTTQQIGRNDHDMNLITGKAGAPHITSSDQGAMQAGLVGNGNYLLQGGDGKFPAVTMQSANKALVPVLNLVIEGRYARVTAAETVTIESGVTGRNRNDLICVKYTRDSNNIETIALAVLKGTATSGTAADPTVPSGSILNNSGTVWIPIARIPISGITAGTPVMLVKQLPPMSQLWDSVALTAAFKFQDTGSFVGALYGGSNTITVKGQHAVCH